MKRIIIFIFMIFSFNASAKNPVLKEELVVTKIKHNDEKKYYEISLTLMAGVYKADEKLVGCLQKSLEKRMPAKISYEAMGLKILSCDL